MTSRDPLFARLAALWRRRDPMPEDLPERILGFLATDGIDLEYELLTLTHRSDSLLGTRSDDASQLLLEFQGDGCTVLLRITRQGRDRRVDGWCEPGTVVQALLNQGETEWRAELHSPSRFVFEKVPSGLSRLTVLVDAAEEHRRLRSPQVEI